MRLTLLGTGCPVASAERLGPGTLIRHGDVAVLVDCGSGVAQRLVQAGCPGRGLDAVLVTHIHSDHLVDLYQLIVSSWHQGREKPWLVYGPPALRPLVKEMMALWQDERQLRIAHEHRPSTTGLEVEVRPLHDDGHFAIGGLAIESFAVDHRPVEPAFGLAFGAGEGTEHRRLVLSGDTCRCPAVVAAAKGADLLVHEVFVHAAMTPEPGVRSRETIDRVAAYHTSSGEVGKIATEAGAGALALTHIVPPSADRAALLREVAADFSGPVIVGEDLMEIDLDGRALRHGTLHLSLGRTGGD
ncbi:MBL fold metallo-hydrolase [Kaustia mangrovi]|uniref:MBL fold metallo-hydrolase n=1 Tax=Kaustia mangrovi TaxID=2593653 RepID=A0A7S8C7D6_9HYPH|nr:MBL fold metallo-hydrolase [Kaustia mangrovi]QPC44732.1 MBL fold metallo-hydrolase [Kaustia mangrovi]